MSSSAVVAITKTALFTAWDTSLALIREENTLFDPEGRAWIQLRFPGARISRGDIGEPGQPLVDEVGSFMVDSFVPAHSGDDLARVLADAVWDIFGLKDINGVRYDERLGGQSGWREPDGVGGVWWGLSYGIRYRYLSV